MLASRFPVLAYSACLLLAACGGNEPRGDPYVAAFRRLRPSIALVTADVVGREGAQTYGSASVVKSNRHGTWLLTAAHVVARAHVISVRIGARPLGRARVTARDPAHDAAIIFVGAGTVPAVRFGDSGELEAGTRIGVAGYPVPDAFAEQHLPPTPSMYAGRVASLRSRMLEIDAPIIPGDSGGPVFDAASGLVVGLSEARFDDERAIGLAIPINRIKPFLHRALLSLDGES
jgi:serine protease Do